MIDGSMYLKDGVYFNKFINLVSVKGVVENTQYLR